jgi:hypothetical protein
MMIFPSSRRIFECAAASALTVSTSLVDTPGADVVDPAVDSMSLIVFSR